VMMKRKSLIARLERDDRNRAMSDVRSAKNLRGDSVDRRNAYSERKTNVTKHTTITKPKVYRSKDDASGTGVFKNYR